MVGLASFSRNGPLLCRLSVIVSSVFRLLAGAIGKEGEME